MRIEARHPGAVATAGPQNGRQAARPGFRLESGGSTAAQAARAAAPLASLDTILALQVEEDPRERRRRGARRAQDLLDELDRLKAALLGGAIGPGDLGRLSDRLAAASGPTGDPALDDVVAAIRLRAEVEMAKLERASAAPAGRAAL